MPFAAMRLPRRRSIVSSMPSTTGPAETRDPQDAGDGALAGREDGADQQQLGTAPRPLLREYRRERADEDGEAGWQAWHGGVSRRGCASLTNLPRTHLTGHAA